MTDTILTEEARRRNFIFCSEYGCTNVVPDHAEADRQGWGQQWYWYKGMRRRCPGPHHYAWEKDGRGR